MVRVATLLFLLALAPPLEAAADPIRIVASIPDVALIAKAVGGEAVQVDSIVTGNRDVHGVELLPSLMLKVRRADIYVTIGMGLDRWSRQIIDGSRNAGLIVVDPSTDIERLDVPTFKVDASHGDVHVQGNPHYWLDPLNAGPIARAIAAALARVAPENAATFDANADAYAARMAEHTERWRSRLAPHAGARVVSFHDSWPYFARRFGIDVVAFLEPKPGVPPTPSHVASLQKLLASGGAQAILMESYFDDRVPRMLERTTGVPVVKVPVLVGARDGVDDQVELFDAIVSELASALEGARRR